MTYHIPYWRRAASLVLSVIAQAFIIASRPLRWLANGSPSLGNRISVNAWLLPHIPKEYR